MDLLTIAFGVIPILFLIFLFKTPITRPEETKKKSKKSSNLSSGGDSSSGLIDDPLIIFFTIYFLR